MTRLCQWLVTVALLFVFVSAGPVEIQKRRGVSLPLKYGVSRVTRGSNVRRGNLKRSRSSIISDLNLQLEEVKRKYFDETAPVSDAPLRKRITSESVNLTDIGYDYSYFAQVQVGIPPQTFDIEIGTGSADFWLASEFCCSNTTITHKFNSLASTTWVNSTKSFKVEYLSGNVSGWIGADTVSLGDFSIEGQTFGVADYVPAETQIADPLTGLMGLAWQALAVIPGLPWWQGIMSRGELQEPLFGVYLARHLLETNGGALAPGGSLDLGFTNTAYYIGDIVYSNLTAPRKKFWQAPIQSLNINGHIVDAGNSNAIVDVATSWIVAPTNIVKDLYAQLPGSKPGTGDLKGYYTIPCNTNATRCGWIFDLGSGATSHVCIGALQGFDSPSYTWVLGGVFLKNVYSVYRYDPPSVGFAQLSPDVRYSGTGNGGRAHFTRAPPTKSSYATSVPPSPSTTTSRGAGVRGSRLPGKAALSTCTTALLWITLSHWL